jgi:DNA-binding transcriptional ArsR family regulator
MLTVVNMMSASKSNAVLAERLERLGDNSETCCVPGEYIELAHEILESERFGPALRRAKALADEHRLLALALLKRRRELCACEIQAATGLTHATVSHHMSFLVEADLVRSRRQGKWRYYRLADRPEVIVP